LVCFCHWFFDELSQQKTAPCLAVDSHGLELGSFPEESKRELLPKVNGQIGGALWLPTFAQPASICFLMEENANVFIGNFAYTQTGLMALAALSLAVYHIIGSNDVPHSFRLRQKVKYAQFDLSWNIFWH